MQQQRVYSGAPWEKTVSYCRAIKSGYWVAVSGTTSMKNGVVFAPGKEYLQTMRCFEIIEESLKEFGMNRSHIIRTRMFVTKISHWEKFGKAHHDFFKDCPPATTMVEVSSLISPELLIEIEADAVMTE